ncbi:hypothetical protein PI126_g1463 [Phytophthora idaei]|nr:hypothetical protein PI126_g1463 [Phytophthora idaei]
MTRTNKKSKNPSGSLPDDEAKGYGVKDDGPSEVEATLVSVEDKTSGTLWRIIFLDVRRACKQ